MHKYRFLCDKNIHFEPLESDWSETLKVYLKNCNYEINVTSDHSFDIQDRISHEWTSLSDFTSLRAKVTYLYYRLVSQG